MPRGVRKTNVQTNGANGGAKEEGVAAYFRPIFKANRKWLKGRSNKAILDKWLEDHPGHAEVPGNVKSGYGGSLSAWSEDGSSGTTAASVLSSLYQSSGG